MIINLGETSLRTKQGDFRFRAWYDGHSEVYSVHIGDIRGAENVPVRVHSSCVTAHYFSATECDCREQLEMAQDEIAKAGKGVLVVLNQQAKDNGILATLHYKSVAGEDSYSAEAYKQMGYPSDARKYLSAAFVLKELGVKSIVLLSNSRDKREQLEAAGIIVADRASVIVDTTERPDLAKHYQGKRDVEGHDV